MMLSLTPLSGLQAVIKRRNSKAARRDSLSIEHSNLALPGGIRRFSSSEALNFQLSATAPNVATVSRKSSFTRKIRKISVGSNQIQSEAVDTCTSLDLHIAQIKKKLAEFREEDVEISERVEELTNTVDELCLNYHVPLDSDYGPHMTYTEDTDEEEFLKFCQIHNHLLHKSLGYSTLPASGARKVLSTSASYPKRSLSYEDQSHSTVSATLLHSNHKPLLPRNSYPSNTSHLFDHQNHDQGHRPRPLSYQDICYDENDYDENSSDQLEGSWSELSCP